MSKVFTPAQRKKLVSDLSERISNDLRYELTDLECGYDGGWFKPIQESILESIASAVTPMVKSAVEGFELAVEREENTKLQKLEAQNKELKKDLRKYAAIKLMIDEASGEVS